MAQIYPVSLRPSDARKLQDYGLIERDLVECAELCRMASETPSDLLWKALWVAAIVAYCRCFCGPRSTSLDHREVLREPDERAAHRRINRMRNNYAAHAGYDLTIGRATVTVMLEDGKPPQIAHARPVWTGQWAARLGNDEVGRLAHLAGMALHHVRGLMEAEAIRLEPIVLAMPVSMLLPNRMPQIVPMIVRDPGERED